MRRRCRHDQSTGFIEVSAPRAVHLGFSIAKVEQDDRVDGSRLEGDTGVSS